jgi:hypothetical protein
MESIKVDLKTVTVGKQDRTPAEAAKVEAIKGMLDIILPEEIDQFFLKVMDLSVELGYRLQAEPKVLLSQIEKANA